MTQSERKPMILVIAGPNGSGKSTITQFFDIVGTYTNADDVVKTTGMSVIDAAKFVDEKRYESINNKQDFTFETVLSSQYKLDILKKAKADGYFIKCVFVLTADHGLRLPYPAVVEKNHSHSASRNAPMSYFAILNYFSFCGIDFIFYSAKLNYS